MDDIDATPRAATRAAGMQDAGTVWASWSGLVWGDRGLVNDAERVLTNDGVPPAPRRGADALAG